MGQSGLIGSAMQAPVDVSYLADTVVLFRYFENAGRIRKAISVVKKRAGYHESHIREYSVSSAGVNVGEPLTKFRGILTGVPEFCPGTEPTIEKEKQSAKTMIPVEFHSNPNPADEPRDCARARPGRDAKLACGVLATAALPAHACSIGLELRIELKRGAGALLIADEALTPDVARAMDEYLVEQAPWSDLPLIVMTAPTTKDTGPSFPINLAPFGNVIAIGAIRCGR